MVALVAGDRVERGVDDHAAEVEEDASEAGHARRLARTFLMNGSTLAFSIHRATTRRSCSGSSQITLLPAPRAEKLDGEAHAHGAPPRVQPPEKPVAGVDRARPAQLVDPTLGQKLVTVPDPPPEDEQAEARVIPAAHPEPAAPVRAARHGRHPDAVDLDPGVVVGLPLPLRRGADGAHHRFAQHLGEGTLEHAEERQAQPVDADVVVLPVGAGRAKAAECALDGASQLALSDVPVVVDAVGFAPERALPLARLLKELTPGDAPVLRRHEALVGSRGNDWFVDVADQAAVDRHAGEHGEIALGDAEAHVGPPGVAPLRGNPPAANDEAVEPAARAHRAEHATR